MKVTFLKLFLIYTFKDPNLAEKLINLAEKKKKKIKTIQNNCNKVETILKTEM